MEEKENNLATDVTDNLGLKIEAKQKLSELCDDTRDRAHPATDVMREADEILALESQVPHVPGKTWTACEGTNHRGYWHVRGEMGTLLLEGLSRELAYFIVALRNRAPAVIRALRERVKIDQADRGRYEKLVDEQQARIAALEAKADTAIRAFDRARDKIEELEAERSLLLEWSRYGVGPTPAEIAARVEQNKKEKDEHRNAHET